MLSYVELRQKMKEMVIAAMKEDPDLDDEEFPRHSFEHLESDFPDAGQYSKEWLIDSLVQSENMWEGLQGGDLVLSLQDNVLWSIYDDIEAELIEAATELGWVDPHAAQRPSLR